MLPDIQCYPVLIYQLFYNLISNALKFSKPQNSPRIRKRYTVIKINGRDFGDSESSITESVSTPEMQKKYFRLSPG
jgi:signal transduction histidine kinase